jgi:hypothetical protein
VLVLYAFNIAKKKIMVVNAPPTTMSAICSFVGFPILDHGIFVFEMVNIEFAV